MTRTWIRVPFAVVAAAAVLLLLATLGMGSANAQTTEEEPVPVLISADPVEPGLITVTGSATRTVDNDTASVNLTVSSTRDRAIDAVLDVNAAMDDVIVGLMAVGIEATDLHHRRLPAATRCWSQCKTLTRWVRCWTPPSWRAETCSR